MTILSGQAVTRIFIPSRGWLRYIALFDELGAKFFSGADAVLAVLGGVILAGVNSAFLFLLFFTTMVITLFFSGIAIQHKRQGIFLFLFFPMAILICLAAASTLPSSEKWQHLGPLLLILGLLTLVNAPFDWASLGLTRALLRRGLELGGWWPYLLALVDAILAAIIVAILGLVMVIGVQAFDGLVVSAGDKPVLPLDAFFGGIAANATAPEFWWVYALLLSTMIPSLVNLMIGGASLLRGVPGLPSLLLRFMPAGKAVPAFERHWLALMLTLQIFIGAALGILAQAFLAVVVIVYIMPPFGLGLLDMAREVAAFNLPLRVGQFFTGTF